MSNRMYPIRPYAYPCLLTVAALGFAPVTSYSAQWTIEPSLQVQETYTDNVALTERGEEDFISQINPGFSLRADGRRLNVNLGYTLQNIFYAKDSARNSRFHSLGADASAELIKNFGFLNLSANDSQRVISPSRGLPLDNLNTANRTDVSTRTINPYIKQRLGKLAEATVSYSYKTVNFQEGASDARIEALNADLRSGSDVRRLSWSLTYAQNTTKRESASDYSREASSIQAEYRINRNWYALVRAGEEHNDLATPQNRGFINGSYFAAGVSIVPHSTLRIELLTGTQLDSASISWLPSPRSQADISWRDQKIGLNPGNVWQASVRLGSRHATWGASYLEDTTSVQGLGSLGGGTQQTQSSSLSITGFQLTDELFLRKLGQLNFGYKTAKSDINMAVYEERRDFLTISDSEKSRGGNFSWRWHFSRRTDLLLNFRGLKSHYRASVGGGSGRLRSMDISLLRRLVRRVEATVMARMTSQDGLTGGRSYDEKRISASAKWLF